MLKGTSVRLGRMCDRTLFTPEGRPRHVLIIAESYRKRFIENESAWIRMIEDRNLTVHTYDENFARARRCR